MFDGRAVARLREKKEVLQDKLELQPQERGRR